MLIKYKGISSSLHKKFFPLYFIIGSDPYLQNDITWRLKNAWRKLSSCDEKVIEINNDWNILFDEANNYSLFANLTLLDVRYNKKTLNKNFATSVCEYLNKYNNKCLIVIKAPFISIKQVQFLTNNSNALVALTNPLATDELENWIKLELKNQNIKHDSNVPNIIHQYCQNNMLAASQVITKLSLINEDNKLFSVEMVLEYLSNQNEYQIYDLAPACLKSDYNLVFDILNKTKQDNDNVTYVLWLLNQEIRTLIKLKQLIEQQINFNNACNQLKIWTQKIKLYEQASRRLSIKKLHTLLKLCADIDETIKSNYAINVWDRIEQLALLITGSENDELLVNKI